MKIKIYMFVALLGCSNAIIAMKALEKKQGEVAGKQKPTIYQIENQYNTLRAQYDGLIQKNIDNSAKREQVETIMQKAEKLKNQLHSLPDLGVRNLLRRIDEFLQIMKALEKEHAEVEYKIKKNEFTQISKYFDETIDKMSASIEKQTALATAKKQVEDILKAINAIQEASYFKGHELDFDENGSQSWLTVSEIEGLLRAIEREIKQGKTAEEQKKKEEPAAPTSGEPTPTVVTSPQAQKQQSPPERLPIESTEEQSKQARLQEVKAQLEKERQERRQALREEQVKANAEELKRQEVREAQRQAAKEQYLEQENDNKRKKELNKILTSTIPSLRKSFDAIMKQKDDVQKENDLFDLLHGSGAFLVKGGVFNLASISYNPELYEQVAASEAYKLLVKDIETARVNLILAKPDYKDLKSNCEAALKEKPHNYEKLTELKRLLFLLNEDLGKLRVENKDLIQPYLDLARQIHDRIG